MFYIKHRVLFTVHGVELATSWKKELVLTERNTGQREENRNRYYWDMTGQRADEE
jgi:hypothetical protein